MQPRLLLSALSSLILFVSVALGQKANSDGTSDITRQLSDYLDRIHRKKFSGTVLVVHNGQQLLHKGYGYADRSNEIPNHINTVYDIGSVTKQFTAAAILKLEMNLKLSVNDAIELYLPEFKNLTPSRSIHHLLTHTAGFPGAIGSDYDPINEETFVEKALESVMEKSWDHNYEYSNVGYSLLAIIIERVSGMKYEEYLAQMLFEPAGMENTGYVIPVWKTESVAIGYRKSDRWGTPLEKRWSLDGPYLHLKGNGGILSTTVDLYKWHLALKGNHVLSEEAKEKYYKKHVAESADESSFYGYGWAIFPSQNKGDLIAHNGGNGVFFCRLPQITGIGSNDNCTF